ncbi:MAG TPA: YkgJ family cysteine cluster protein [Acidimicrobiales bacterium]|jgi:hypothetical protein|nr:YkgJ family cysteine cluster protein [Acidimicrobiales bacterium]
MPPESICLACGLCCDGTLFARTQLAGEEIVRLGRRHGTMAASMPQPCACLKDGRCGIYDERPQVCRSFRCTLLERHQDGQVGREESLRVIAAAKAAHAALLEVLPPGMSLPDLRRAAAAGDSESQPWRAARHQVYLRLCTLEDHLQRHFRPPLTEEDAAGS